MKEFANMILSLSFFFVSLDFDIYDPSHHEVLFAACTHQLFKYLWIAPLSTRGSAERMNEQTGD